jgi:hypothetical protein
MISGFSANRIPLLAAQACAVTKTKGQWQRQLHYTSKPRKSTKGAEGYSAMLNSSTNKSTFTIMALVFRLVNESHLVGTEAACKAAVANFNAAKSARGEQLDEPDQLESLPAWAPSAAQPPAGAHSDNVDKSSLAYW